MRILRPAILLNACLLLSFFSHAMNAAAANAASTVPSTTIEAPAPPPEPQPAPVYSGERFQYGVGIKVSSLGIGGEAAFALMPHVNVRVGVNAFTYSHTFTESNISYPSTLKLQSAQATLDLFAFGSFHISPGALLYNRNHVDSSPNVPGNTTFTLNGVSYVSDPSNPTHGIANLTMAKAAPMVLVGFGNLVPRSASKHLSISIESGVVLQGLPNVRLALTGNACDAPGVNCRDITNDPTFQTNALAEENNLVNKAKPFKYYPVISIGFGWKF